MRLRNETITLGLKRKRYLDSKYLIDINGNIFNENTGNILVPCKRGNGYLKISLYVNGKTYQPMIHRLVAMLFLPNPDNKRCVNHKNGIKTDNRVENLEWSTDSENIIHAHKTGLRQIGNELWNGKFSREDIAKIKQMRLSGIKLKEIAKEMKCCESAISHIIVGRNYKYYNL